MVFGADETLKGITIRHSYDTPSHVEDVVEDIYYMETWNGKTWEELAGMQDLKANDIYGVSGATRTSLCLAEGLAYRAAFSLDQAQARSVRWHWKALGLINQPASLNARIGSATMAKAAAEPCL